MAGGAFEGEVDRLTARGLVAGDDGRAGALRPEAEGALLSRLTDLLMAWEGFDPADPVMREVSWVFLHRPAAVYVAGAPADAPRYKIVATVPEGQFDARSRAEGSSRGRDCRAAGLLDKDSGGAFQEFAE